MPQTSIYKFAQLSMAVSGHDIADFTIFNKYDWVSILSEQPKFADRCDFRILTYGATPEYEWLELTDKDGGRICQFTAKTLDYRRIWELVCVQ